MANKSSVKKQTKPKTSSSLKRRGKNHVGWILIIVGILLITQIILQVDLIRLWPLALILVGWRMLSR